MDTPEPHPLLHLLSDAHRDAILAAIDGDEHQAWHDAVSSLALYVLSTAPPEGTSPDQLRRSAVVHAASAAPGLRTPYLRLGCAAVQTAGIAEDLAADGAEAALLEAWIETAEILDDWGAAVREGIVPPIVPPAVEDAVRHIATIARAAGGEGDAAQAIATLRAQVVEAGRTLAAIDPALAPLATQLAAQLGPREPPPPPVACAACGTQSAGAFCGACGHGLSLAHRVTVGALTVMATVLAVHLSLTVLVEELLDWTSAGPSLAMALAAAAAPLSVRVRGTWSRLAAAALGLGTLAGLVSLRALVVDTGLFSAVLHPMSLGLDALGVAGVSQRVAADLVLVAVAGGIGLVLSPLVLLGGMLPPFSWINAFASGTSRPVLRHGVRVGAHILTGAIAAAVVYVLVVVALACFFIWFVSATVLYMLGVDVFGDKPKRRKTLSLPKGARIREDGVVVQKGWLFESETGQRVLEDGRVVNQGLLFQEDTGVHIDEHGSVKVKGGLFGLFDQDTGVALEDDGQGGKAIVKEGLFWNSDSGYRVDERGEAQRSKWFGLSEDAVGIELGEGGLSEVLVDPARGDRVRATDGRVVEKGLLGDRETGVRFEGGQAKRAYLLGLLEQDIDAVVDGDGKIRELK